MTKKQTDTNTIRKVFAIILAALSLVCIVLGGLAYWGGSYATDMVRNELQAQNIKFPAADAPNFKAEDYPKIHKYAGQTVDSGDKAKAYAEYIGSHLEVIADGKTYSEISSEYQKDKTNEKLAAQRQQLFMGETLRGILLGTGYSYGLIGQIALIAATVLIVVAVASGLGAGILFMTSRR